MNRSIALRAFKITIPVLFGYLAIGIPFGLLVVKAGYPWWLAPVMSILMYAGAGQYMAIGLFSAGASLSTLLVTTLLVNIRHIIYGLSLINPFKGTGRWKPYLIFALTDETYALMTGCEPPPGSDPGSFYGLVALFDHLYWITGTVIGAVVGTLIPFPLEGIDFALTALFVVLLMDQLQKRENRMSAVIGICCGIAALLAFGPGHMLIAALAMGIACLALFHGAVSRGESRERAES
ncbi:MAG: AzlC family ABC transporter permease [Spirochaetaceae bacterium]|jgi:4-azaleucine resistance transporter AzlC|nr:AzlC family ABC transporter permease [Spirochaetaceae bacterium]